MRLQLEYENFKNNIKKVRIKTLKNALKIYWIYQIHPTLRQVLLTQIERDNNIRLGVVFIKYLLDCNYRNAYDYSLYRDAIGNINNIRDLKNENPIMIEDEINRRYIEDLDFDTYFENLWNSELSYEESIRRYLDT